MFHRFLSFGTYGQWIVAVMATLCTLTTGQFYAWPSAALPMIKNNSAGFSLGDSEIALMITITFIGNSLSPIPSGILMDKIGRRLTLSLGLLLAIASWALLAFFTATEAIYVARFLSGSWGGVVYTVVPAFLGEVVDPKIRGAFGAFFAFNLYAGALYESLASAAPYRLFIFISSIPSVLLFFAFLFLPESPYYYLRKGKKEKAKSSIIWLKGACNDKDLDRLQDKVDEQMQMKGTYCDIFRTKGGRKAFLIVEFLQMIQRLSGVTFLFAYTTVVLPDSWISAENSFLVLTIIWMVFSFLSSLIIDLAGRKVYLVISSLGSGLSMAGVTVWYYLRDFSEVDTSTTNWCPLVLLIVSGIFYSLGMVSIPNLVQAELYPVNLKSKGSALACITANLFSVVSTSFFYVINENIGVYFNFLVMAVAPLVCVVFVFAVMIETKGKSLEEIQDKLNGRKVIIPVSPSGDL